MDSFEFWSKDRHFGLLLSEKIVEKMVEECANAKGKETGGILAGYYTPALDRAIVTELTGPPQDSVQSCWTFYRGVHGLHAWFMRLWRDKRHYYLGEWHFHPGGSPVPSSTDNRQMVAISEDQRTKCPEPVLLLIGGDPSKRWEPRAYVYPRGKTRDELLKQGD